MIHKKLMQTRPPAALAALGQDCKIGETAGVSSRNEGPPQFATGPLQVGGAVLYEWTCWKCVSAHNKMAWISDAGGLQE